VRPQMHLDEPAILLLLGQLGYDVSAEQLQGRLQELSSGKSDPVLVATFGGNVVGLIALHWSVMLHHSAPVGRITTLVVDDTVRGKGVGRVLVEAGLELARQAGCEMLELTTGTHRTQAHAFYKALGFINSSLKFSRPLLP
jgi:GNAT superfamily N-acetyltransferase